MKETPQEYRARRNRNACNAKNRRLKTRYSTRLNKAAVGLGILGAFVALVFISRDK